MPVSFLFEFARPVTRCYRQRRTWKVSLQVLAAIWKYGSLFGRTMMQALELLQLVKRHISGQSDVEQWRNSLSGYQVTLVWRHQIVSQSIEKSVKKEIFKQNFITNVRIDLKTFLGLAMLNHCNHAITK